MKKKSQQLRKINDRHYRYFQAILLSFYSAKLYVDVAKRWKGYGLLYLLLAILVLSLPFGVRSALNIAEHYDKELLEPLRLIPVLSIKNEMVDTNKPMPWKIKNNQGKVKVIIDTSGKYTQLDTTLMPDLRVLITKNTFSYVLPKPPAFFINMPQATMPKVFQAPFSASNNGTFSGEILLKLTGINRVIWMTALAVWPLILATIFGLCLVLILVFSMMGQLVSQVIFKHTITYAQACRLMSVSFTPQIALTFLYLSLYKVDQLPKGIALILSAVYFSYAIIVNKRDSKKLVRT